MTKQALSEPWKRLVELMQSLNFGRVAMFVRAGEPDFSKPFRTVRTVKAANGESGPRPEASRRDFEVRKEVTVLIEQAAQAADGARLTVEVKGGLPFLIEIEQEHQA
jgi:hypothetical protein